MVGSFTTAYSDFDIGSQCQSIWFMNRCPFLTLLLLHTFQNISLSSTFASLAVFSQSFQRLPFTLFFLGLRNLIKSGLTVSGAPSWGQTCWRKTKVFIHLVHSYLSRQGRRNAFYETQKLINFLFSGFYFH